MRTVIVKLDISLGSVPSVDKQIQNPRLKGFFVGLDGIHLLRIYEKLFSLVGIEEIITVDGYRYAFTNSVIYKIKKDLLELPVKVASFMSGNSAVRADNNSAKEIGFCNGLYAYVYNITENAITKLSNTQGFDLVTPIDVVNFDTLMVFIGSKEREFISSNANDALTYNATEVKETASSIGNLIGISHIENNLYIFGEHDIQRWTPTPENSPGSFPFILDTNYNDGFGSASTASVIKGNNVIYFLSNNGQIRQLTGDSEQICSPGIAEEINSKTDAEISDSTGSFYYHKGSYFYQISFSDNAYVYCVSSRKLSETSTIVSASDGDVSSISGELMKASVNFANLTEELVIQTSYSNFGDGINRYPVSIVYLWITQGKTFAGDNNYIYLSVSRDNVKYGNEVKKKLSAPGKRLSKLIWKYGMHDFGFSFRFRFSIKSEISVISSSINSEVR